MLHYNTQASSAVVGNTQASSAVIRNTQASSAVIGNTQASSAVIGNTQASSAVVVVRFGHLFSVQLRRTRQWRGNCYSELKSKSR